MQLFLCMWAVPKQGWVLIRIITHAIEAYHEKKNNQIALIHHFLFNKVGNHTSKP